MVGVKGHPSHNHNNTNGEQNMRINFRRQNDQDVDCAEENWKRYDQAPMSDKLENQFRLELAEVNEPMIIITSDSIARCLICS